ncbi:hypothetical protein ACPW7J_04805 [Ihubacter sp. rT4E-8]|uniref:hypothetical protein n=1 Tax=Ihubacter sp. rT4E-8 TaxID=3242369 RepID=UPI003CF99272
MKMEEKFLSAIGDIEDDFISEAAACTPAAVKKPKNLWLRYGCLAACLVIAVVACVKMMPVEKGSGGNPLPQDNMAKLPILTIEEKQRDSHSEKRTKKVLAEESVRETENPWKSGSKVELLPVYSNDAFIANDENLKAAEEAAIVDRVLLAAAAVDMDVKADDVVIGCDYGEKDDGAVSFIAKAENDEGTIQSSRGHELLIQFADEVELPEECRIPKGERTQENMERVTAWLLDKYADLAGFEEGKAVAEAVWKEEWQKWMIGGYEKTDTLEGDIVSYNLKRVFFHLDDAGNLQSIFIKDYLAGSEKIEEYPIISEDEAKRLLALGDYVTRYDHDMPGLGYIQRISLVYLAGDDFNIFMPYYAFDVKLPEGMAPEGDGEASLEGETGTEGAYVDCATYYVPAVKSDYIANMPKGKIS